MMLVYQELPDKQPKVSLVEHDFVQAAHPDIDRTIHFAYLGTNGLPYVTISHDTSPSVSAVRGIVSPLTR
ncbi:hypothetical protein E2C01_056706 [Portunus trituberculatus]|uniref:Uncharacterized protein n=1 Tax=Portunus trituberculatus TaxID=210409 RepID=A0A5B7GZW4_PORTR|nr:hypothetical protein [Portunus trituberculatus]